MTVSRRYSPRRARFGGHSLHRNGRAPDLWHAVTVVGQPYARVPPTSRLEPLHPPSGEAERCPDSSAPRTDFPRVDGLHQSFRSTQTHASGPRCLQSSRPTDTFDALCASRPRCLSTPRLSRESEKHATFVAVVRWVASKNVELAVAIFRSLLSPIHPGRSTKFACGQYDCFSTDGARFAQFIHSKRACEITL